MKTWFQSFRETQKPRIMGNVQMSEVTNDRFSLYFPQQGTEFVYERNRTWSEKMGQFTQLSIVVVQETTFVGKKPFQVNQHVLWENEKKNLMCVTLRVEKNGQLFEELGYDIRNVTKNHGVGFLTDQEKQAVDRLLEGVYDVLCEDKTHRLPLVTGKHAFKWMDEK